MTAPGRGWRYLGSRPELAPPLAAVADFLSGFRQVVTGPAAIDALLADPTTRVPYQERSERLGVGRFPLALDGEEHVEARALIAAVLRDTVAAHQAGIAKARRQALDIVASTGPRLDVVADLIDPVLRTWCETWLGLPGEGLHLQRVGQLTTHTVFLNPRAPEPRVPGQGIDCDGLARCVELIAEQRARWAPMVAAAPEGSVVRALHEHPSVASPDEVTAHTVGLTVGPLALGSRAVAIAVDELLKRPEQFAAITDETAATAAFDRVLAVRPPLPGVPRRRGGHEVLALTQAAAAVAASDPAAWAFGAGPHRCMGRPQISEAAAAILLALAPTRPTRSDGPRGRLRMAHGPSGVRSWPFEGHLVVDLNP